MAFVKVQAKGSNYAPDQIIINTNEIIQIWKNDSRDRLYDARFPYRIAFSSQSRYLDFTQAAADAIFNIIGVRL